MAGIGQRGLALSTRLTARATVRTVVAADVSVDAIAEILDTRLPEGVGEVPRGDHATLVLYVMLCGVEAVTIELYGRADVVGEEDPDLSSSSSSSSSSSAEACHDWAKYGEAILTGPESRMVVLPDMPASEYKVMVTGITGSGSVIVREQHSA
jgi:hypothetical protein